MLVLESATFGALAMECSAASSLVSDALRFFLNSITAREADMASIDDGRSSFVIAFIAAGISGAIVGCMIGASIMWLAAGGP